MYQLTFISPKYGYYPKTSKTYLIVKEYQLPNATVLFNNSNAIITVEGKRHVGAVVGRKIFKREYVDKLVKAGNSQLYILSSIAERQS